MKKKSHLSLARYLIDSMQNDDLHRYRKSFLIGSILPDCKPSFFTKRHTITETFDILVEEIKKITQDYDFSQGLTSEFCRRLGVVTHYIADYFTYPHNSIFVGSMTEHISYEIELMEYFRQYLASGKADEFLLYNNNFYSAENICEFIKQKHEEYIGAIKIIAIDCKYIVQLCVHVVKAILQIFEINFHGEPARQVKVA